MPASEKLEMIEEQAIDKEEQNPLYLAARKVVLFSIGVVALTVEGIETLADRLIERGEIAEKESRKLLREASQKSGEEVRAVESKMSKPVKDVKSRMTLPSKAEIDALNEKITRLSEQIDELNKTKSSSS
jgi:polyhydroxyalkanoate synthesis regulator phasin